MSFYKSHLFICNNKKPGGKNCCGSDSTEELIAYAKRKAKELGMTKDKGFRISSSGCMGRCKSGPVIVEYPSGKWFKCSTKDAMDRILHSILQVHQSSTINLELK